MQNQPACGDEGSSQGKWRNRREATGQVDEKNNKTKNIQIGSPVPGQEYVSPSKEEGLMWKKKKKLLILVIIGLT